MAPDTASDSDEAAPTSPVAAANWRPGRTNTMLGALATIGLVGLLIGMSGHAVPAISSGVGGLCLAVVLLLATTSRRRVVARALASLLLIPTGGLLLAGVGLAAQTATSGIQLPLVVGAVTLTIGVGVATGSAVATPWQLLERDRLKAACIFGIVVGCLPFVAGGLSVAASTDLGATVSEMLSLTVQILLATAPAIAGYPAVGLTLVLTVLALTALRRGLRSLPVIELAPRDRRAELRRRLQAINHLLRRSRQVVVLLPLALVILWLVSQAAGFRLPPSLVELPVGIGTSTPLRALVLILTAVGLGTEAGTWGVTRLARLDGATVAKWGVPNLGGGLLVVIAVFRGSTLISQAIAGPLAPMRYTLESLRMNLGASALLIGAGLLCCAIPLGVYLLLWITTHGLLPKRATSAALGCVGLFVAAIGSLLLNVMPLVSFLAIAGTLFVWDVSSHAVSVGAEVGRQAQTRRAELVHTGGSLLIASVGIGVATLSLLTAARLAQPDTRAAPVILVAALAGTLLLITGLRSR